MLKVQQTWMYFLVGSIIIFIFLLISQTQYYDVNFLPTIPSPMDTIKDIINHQESTKLDTLSKKIKSIHERTYSASQQPAKVVESVTLSKTAWQQLDLGMRMGERVIRKMKEDISYVMSEYPFQARQSLNYLGFIKKKIYINVF